MKKEKCLLVLLLIISILSIMSVNVLAVEAIPPASSNTGVQNITDTNTGNVNRITPTNENTNTNTTNKVNNVTPVGNANSSLPYAGTNSTAVFIIIILVVSSIYAYKKVSDYNINVK